VPISPQARTQGVGQTQLALNEGARRPWAAYWSSSEPGDLTIERDGRASARPAGTAMLAATVDGGLATPDVPASD
jgi:hypothetical protein